MAHPRSNEELPYVSPGLARGRPLPVLTEDSQTGHEVEAKIAAFHAQHGQVMFGGKLLSEMDDRYAIPDNLGGHSDRLIGGPRA
jgi:hypothetical protein